MKSKTAVMLLTLSSCSQQHAYAISPKVATAAAVTTIAVNLLTIDKTAKATWKAAKATKHATVKVAKKVVGR